MALAIGERWPQTICSEWIGGCNSEAAEARSRAGAQPLPLNATLLGMYD